ncbi:cysteine desulfurase [Candidatus Sumerlaeota bacterium]|nr:cysteine desulfurase [Candidatus Sumerlaeota bacterium]
MTALTPRELFFDYNATTPIAPEAIEEMMPFLTEEFGNASTIYAFGVKARYGIERARGRVARALGAKPEEIVFTGGGSESNNLAIKGAALANRERGRHLISCMTEHRAVMEPLHWLERYFDDELTMLRPQRSGAIDLDELIASIREDTVLISLMFANNETGVLHPIEEVGRIARERGILFHCDAIQGVGKEAIDVNALGVDLLSLSGHKIYAPKGVGALYVREGTRLESFIHGGSHERGLRAGTENVAGIVGLGRAIEVVDARREEEMARLRGLKRRLAEGLQSALDGIDVNGDLERSLAGTLNLGIRGISGPRLVALAAEEGICIAAGSACRTGGTASSHVLEAMGLPQVDVDGAVRLSLGHWTSEASVDHLINALPPLIQRVRGSL